MRLTITHKISLLSILLVVITAGVTAHAFYSQAAEQLVTNALEDISNDVQEQGLKMKTHIKTQTTEILFLSKLPPIQGIIRALNAEDRYDALGKSTYQQWTQRLADIFQAALAQYPEYLQLRFIDTSGQEVVNVVRRQGQIQVIPPEQLQNKAHRPYVQDALQLPKGAVNLSEINLNQEYGKIVEPWQEVLRSMTPVYDLENDQLRGILVLNVEVGHELRAIQKAVHASAREVIVTNDRGDYLLHHDKSRTYGFDLGRQYQVQDQTPQLASFFEPDNKDDSLVLLPAQTGTSDVIVYNKVHFDPIQPDRFITVGISQPYEEIIAEQLNILKQTLTQSLWLVLFAATLAILLSLRLARPIRTMTQAVNDFTQKRSRRVKLPIEQNDEIGQLAKSFQSMIKQVEEAQLELHRVNLLQEYKIQERTHELEESEARQRAIVEKMVDGVITIDEQGIVHSVNPAVSTIFGYTEDEIIGNNIKLLMPEPYHSEHDDYLRNYLQTGEKRIIGIGREVEGKHKSGSTFPLDLAVSELEISGKRMFSGLVRDITERKRVEKLKNEFISTVSHELRTPLTSIRGSLGLIKGGAVGELPEQALEMLNIAGSNTERLLLLINDILDIQKIESGEMVFKFQNLELMPFLQQALVEHATFGEQHGVGFVLNSELEGVYIYADKDRLMQVMGNLLSNAAKFSPEGEKVEISVGQQGKGKLRIAVSDHGPGIPESFHAKLFDRFTQSDSSDTRQKGGTGLGLNITKAIVEKHGGEIGFVSHEWVGTTFYVDLPTLDSPNSTRSAPTRLAQKHKQRILIVEDNQDLATLLKRMLAEDGFDGDIAHNSEEARQLLAENQGEYQAITMDIILPNQDGIDFINELRHQPPTQDLPVVVVSVKADEAKRELNGGAISVVDWLEKPIDQPRLLAAIKQAVSLGQTPRVLHVEDEADVHQIVKTILQDQCSLSWSRSLEEARQVLAKETFDLVLLDIGLPDGSGLELLDTIERYVSPPQVVIFSAQDIGEEYAHKVAGVLVKSRTNNQELAKTIYQVIQGQQNKKPPG